MSMNKILILGVTGGYGNAIAKELRSRDIPFRAMVRDVEKSREKFSTHDNIEFITGNAENLNDVKKAAQGCEVIVHGVNYPYDKWVPHMERVTENVVSAAKKSGAMILFPGNIYGLGCQTQGLLSDDVENRPCSKKGDLRVKLEDMLAQASKNDVNVIIVRAGDFFGPTIRNGFVDPVFGNAASNKAISSLGNLDIPHQWAYLPDLARLSVDLLQIRGKLSAFEVINFSGYVVDSQRHFFRSIAAAAGHPDLEIKTTPWFILRIIGLFVGVVRELMELRYLYENSIILGDAKQKKLRPDFKATPIETAIAETIASYR